MLLALERLEALAVKRLETSDRIAIAEVERANGKTRNKKKAGKVPGPRLSLPPNES